ncbi:MAG: hypothetical protein SOV63_00020 [Pyramidobacter porci]|nr:hypothetical protein [Pyramidobacter porci]
MNNPENQYEIALDNFGRGLHEPRRLYDEILKNVRAVGQKMKQRGERTARKMFHVEHRA